MLWELKLVYLAIIQIPQRPAKSKRHSCTREKVFNSQLLCEDLGVCNLRNIHTSPLQQV